MENVRAVNVVLYAGPPVRHGVGVAPDMRPPVDDRDGLSQITGDAFGNGRTETAGADNEESCAGERVHKVLL